MSDYLAYARQINSPNYNQRSQDINLLVIHCISLPPLEYNNNYVEDFFVNKLDTNIDSYFQTIAELKVSSHLYIKRNGEIIQFVSFKNRAWHAGISYFQGVHDCNDYSIGIELQGDIDNPFTKAQYDSLTKASFDILQYYPNITLDRIVGHRDIAPGRKQDPGKYFNWGLYLDKLNNILN